MGRRSFFLTPNVVPLEVPTPSEDSFHRTQVNFVESICGWHVLLCCLLLIFAGCSPAPVWDRRASVAGWLDVSVSGKRYYGMYLMTELDGQTVAASGVLLMPWEDRPDSSIRMQDGGDTLIKIQGQKKRFPGRPLLLLPSSDAEVEVVSANLDLVLYGSRQRMTEAVQRLLLGDPTRER